MNSNPLIFYLEQSTYLNADTQLMAINSEPETRKILHQQIHTHLVPGSRDIAFCVHAKIHTDGDPCDASQ